MSKYSPCRLKSARENFQKSSGAIRATCAITRESAFQFAFAFVHSIHARSGGREERGRTAMPASCTNVELPCQGWTWLRKMTLTFPWYLPPGAKSGRSTLSIARDILAENGQT